MKKLLYIFLGLSLIFACSSDDDNDNTNPPSEPTNFFEAHNGVWIATSFYETINNQLVEVDADTQNLLDIYDNGWDAYSREGNAGCWSIPQSINSGSTTIYTNTPDELYGETININPNELFSGNELQTILDDGYTTVSIAQSYLGYDDPIITWAIMVFAGNFEEELGNVLSATFEKQNSLNFDVCKGMSNNKFYNVSDKVINLTSQTAIQTNK